jgi:positive regulator of sigma E activity
MSNFAIYLTGTVFLAGGLALTAYKLGASTIWICIGVIIVLGLGIMAAVSKTRLKEKSDTDK